jgi:hypothetical protein
MDRSEDISNLLAQRHLAIHETILLRNFQIMGGFSQIPGAQLFTQPLSAQFLQPFFQQTADKAAEVSAAEEAYFLHKLPIERQSHPSKSHGTYLSIAFRIRIMILQTRYAVNGVWPKKDG